MSYHDRAGENANSAVIVTVTPDDFGSDNPLAGISFQRSLEEKAYQAGQGTVPVQSFGDFNKDQLTPSYGKVHSCMKGASVFGDVRGIFPEEIAQSLEDGITAMDHKIHGFAAVSYTHLDVYKRQRYDCADLKEKVLRCRDLDTKNCLVILKESILWKKPYALLRETQDVYKRQGRRPKDCEGDRKT